MKIVIFVPLSTALAQAQCFSVLLIIVRKPKVSIPAQQGRVGR